MPVTFCGFLVACFVHPLLTKHSHSLCVLQTRILSSAHPPITSNLRHMSGATLGWMSPGPSPTTSYTVHTDTRQAGCASHRRCVCRARSLPGDPPPSAAEVLYHPCRTDPPQLSTQNALFKQGLSDISTASDTPLSGEMEGIGRAAGPKALNSV